jgi:hypothetical protein
MLMQVRRVIEKHKEMPGQWKEIAKSFPNRSYNAVKNCWWVTPWVINTMGSVGPH